jgi:hypothetical protein
MQEQIDKLHLQVWEYLKAGEWTEALNVAGQLAKLEPGNKDSAILAGYLKDLELIAYLSVNYEREETIIVRLKEIARAIPHLAVFDSFKALQELVKVPDSEKKYPQESQLTESELGIINAEINQSEQLRSLWPDRSEKETTITPKLMPNMEKTVEKVEVPKIIDTRPWSKRLKRPSGLLGVMATIAAALIVLLLFNFLSYYYLKEQPPETSAYKYVYNKSLIVKSLNLPKRTVLLGDSTCLTSVVTGPFADRLGGQVVNLATVAQTSMLMDAWMLAEYVEQVGVPENLVLVRGFPGSYTISHNIEYMAAMPLPWNFWEHFGIRPAWKPGETQQLFMTKYAALYSASDTISSRVTNIWNIFNHQPDIGSLENTYFNGSTVAADPMDLSKALPQTYLASKYKINDDTTTALRYISDLAKKKNFQLYILFQPEWDEAIKAGLRANLISAQKNYLSQFIDPEYVHIVFDESLTFKKDQMQNPNHLRPGAERVYTEDYVGLITAIQNQLSEKQATPIKLESAEANKNGSYVVNDKPYIPIRVSIPGRSDAAVNGSVSCLIKPAGTTDGDWVIRSPSVPVNLSGNDPQTFNLSANIGKLDKPGTYDLVVFIRQDVDKLSHETRIELSNKISVK